MKALFATSNPILVKEAIKLMGFDCGGVRLPLVDATPEQKRGSCCGYATGWRFIAECISHIRWLLKETAGPEAMRRMAACRLCNAGFCVKSKP